MWFRNLHLYRLHDQQQIEFDTLVDALADQAARPVGGHEARRLGWAVVAESDWHGTTRLVELHGHRLLTALRQERLLPSEVVREEVEEHAAAIEAETGLPVHRREKLAIKEQVIEELLPQAFVKRQRIDLWWDTTRSLIGVACASRKRAEEALDLLRETLGSLKVTPLATTTLPMRGMTQWLTDAESRPADLVLGDTVELKARGDDGVVRGRQVDLDSDDMQQLLASGRQASRLALEIDGRLRFVLHDDLALKSLRFGDALIDEASQADDGDDPLVRLETDFLLMAQALGQSVDRLLEWLGGEAQAGTVSSANAYDGEAKPQPFGGQADPLYKDVAGHVIESGKATVSAVQRKFKIGYNRAAHLVEALEHGGIISPMDAQGRRRVKAGASN